MPELAEVEFFRKQWDCGLGQKIVAVKLHSGKRIFRGANPRQIAVRLQGSRLLRSCARGKRMLFEFSGGNWIGIHLGMTGKLRVEAAAFHPAKHDHLVLFQLKRALVFTDSRQFGRVHFHHGPHDPDWWKSEVPEIISREFDRAFLDRFLARHRKAPIKAVILMQNGFPGIGNWMADEILWRARILPATSTGKLTSRKGADLFRETKFVVNESLRSLGKDFRDPPRGWLIHQKWKRDGVCPRHRTPLCHATIGGRTTAWCPHCQS
jgi:formamidopyrimidine-DNA glycosylase